MADTVAQNKNITEDEAALYDRQIRLWGLEAQQRICTSSILICGMRGLSNEVCKNLVLAGVGAITIIDHNMITEEDLGAQFFVTVEDIGKNKAMTSADRIRQLNPRVKVTSDSSNLSTKPDEFFKSFDLICLTDSNSETMIRIDQICRKFDKKFYAASTYGFFGYIFCDLKQHEYIVERKIKLPHSEEHQIKVLKKMEDYISFQDALSKSDCDYVVLWRFQQEQGRLPIATDIMDINKLKLIRNSFLQSNEIDNTNVSDEFIQTLAMNAPTEIAPVCAIIGGVLAQNILNVLSHKGLPIKNFFLYNGFQGNGYVYNVEQGKNIFNEKAIDN
ncbi:10425_t:CDS:2 [Acaulospora morrowiae]|uniref:Ubiquitin-like 1-activating enzyme E1A n=1 Tax=Acaulospora morrowiae TaxID=94023 RepID=A0A9N8ZY77_9GLOM|nr:10425_t:CDS:2 [Acaulospora morrowiae]